jgi:hypothetical protein
LERFIAPAFQYDPPQKAQQNVCLFVAESYNVCDPLAVTYILAHISARVNTRIEKRAKNAPAVICIIPRRNLFAISISCFSEEETISFPSPETGV